MTLNVAQAALFVKPAEKLTVGPETLANVVLLL